MTHDAQFIAALEPNQMSSAREMPLPRRHLGRGMMLLLVLLRVYVLAAIPVVGYAFMQALNTSP
jgi:hypothetical protein